MVRTALLLLPSLALVAQLSAAQVQFTDVTVAAGLLPHTNGPGDVNDQRGGAAAADFNRDGWPDLFILGRGLRRDRLLINNKNGTFTDRAKQWGVDFRHEGAGVAVGDYNGDGKLDLYVTSRGALGNAVGKHKLYRNTGHSFVNEALAAGVHQASPVVPEGFGAAFGDYDLDGDLDLMVCSWQLLPTPSLGNKLFRNEGNGTFSEVTLAAGLQLDQVGGFSPTFRDMDGDFYPELLIAADFFTSRYYVNNGDGTFSDATVSSGTSQESNGMGSALADFNNDGLFDWYVTSVDAFPTPPQNGNKLYLNQGAHVYQEAATSLGVTDGFWGWGTVASDFDNDGWVDLAETNGRAFIAGFDHTPARLWLNQSGAGFTEQSAAAGLIHDENGLSVVKLDYDLDGDEDLLLTTAHMAELRLYRNDQNTGNSWLRVTLDTKHFPHLAPHGFGTKVSARIGTAWYHRYLDGGCNFLATSELALHFGLGSATVVDELVAHWTDGTTTRYTAVPINTRQRMKPR